MKDPLESKYQLHNKKKKKVAINHEINPKTFIDYSQAIDNVFENLEDY